MVSELTYALGGPRCLSHGGPRRSPAKRRVFKGKVKLHTWGKNCLHGILVSMEEHSTLLSRYVI